MIVFELENENCKRKIVAKSIFEVIKLLILSYGIQDYDFSDHGDGTYKIKYNAKIIYIEKLDTIIDAAWIN